MEKSPIYIGSNLPGSHGTADATIVDTALDQGYDLVTARLTTKAYKKRLESEISGLSSVINSDSSKGSRIRAYSQSEIPVQIPAPNHDEVGVQPGTHTSNIIAIAAPWIELDSKSGILAQTSAGVLYHELAYARFCGLAYVVVPGPKRRTNLMRYAHSLQRLLSSFPQIKILIHTTLSEEYRDAKPPPDLFSTWQAWDTIRTICDHPANLSLALEVSKNPLPDGLTARWFCEPVTMIVLSAPRAFIANPKGYPVLSKHGQTVLRTFTDKNPFILIKDHQGLATLSGEGGPGPFTGGDNSFLLYVRHLMSRLPASSKLDSFTQGFGDVLQAPLHPLDDDLDSSTYALFEEDEEKYSKYQTALELAMSRNLVKLNRIEVIVAGAGRGPIVDSVLAAAVKVAKQVHIYAIEKNEAAVTYLNMRKAHHWNTQVEVINSDMRRWTPPVRPHIIVSELMGSLGDNELSPECLENLEQSLEAGGVMIPASYSAFLAPAFSPRLYMGARIGSGPGRGPVGKQASQPDANARLQIPYVVHIKQADLIAPPKLAWTFSHPKPKNQGLLRSARLSFDVAQKTTLHGFAGYFEAVLYPGISIGTNPETKQQISPGLISWFPMWFPLSRPLNVPADADIVLSLWRQHDERRTWYEWAAEILSDSPISKAVTIDCTFIHNSNGAHHQIDT